MKKDSKFDIQKLLLIFTVAILPFIMHVKMVPISNTEYEKVWFTQTHVYDLFAYYKAVLFCLASYLALCIVYIRQILKKKTLKAMNLIDVSIGVFFVCAIFSLIFSETKYIALFGFVERYEGTFVWLAYLSIFIVARKTITTESCFNNIIRFLLMSSILMSILGVLQSIGVNFTFLPVVKQMIYGSLGGTEALSMKGKAYGTLYNPNYVGSYCSIVIPLALYCIMSEKRKLMPIIALLAASVFLLVSQSSAGLVGMLAGLAFLIATFVVYKSKHRRRIVIILTGVVIIIGTVGGYYSNNIVQKFINPKYQVNYSEEGLLKKYEVTKDNVAIIKIGMDEIHFKMDNNEIVFMDRNNKKINVTLNTQSGNIIFPQKTTEIKFTAFRSSKGNLIISAEKDVCLLFFRIDNNKIYLSNVSGEIVDLKPIQKFGFYAYETVGSSRGYIWARSIPLMKEYLLIGAGADCYGAVFPQEDPFAKAYSFANASAIIDKPHNMYIQIAINFGLIAMAMYILLQILIVIKTIKASFKRSKMELIALASLFVAYSVTIFFNDSTICVSPIYWCVAGMSLGICENEALIE